MSTGVETLDAIAWAGTQLLADSAFVAACPGGAHLGAQPPLTVTPVCSVYTTGGVETLTFNGNHILTDVALMVKIFGPDDSASFIAKRNAAKRAYAVLSRHTGVGAGAEGVTIGCILTQQFPLAEPQLVAGAQWTTLVQLYRVLVQ